MKEILIINGSPKKGGFTSVAARFITEGVEPNLGKIRVINCYDKKIADCIDCGYCGRTCGLCSIKDDMTEIYEQIRNSDIVILASPMYFGMFPGTLKCLIDRCQMFWNEKNVFDKSDIRQKTGFLIFCAGSSWNNMFEPMITVGRYFLNTINCKIKYKVLIDNTDNMSIDSINSNHEIIRCKKMLEDILIDCH